VQSPPDQSLANRSVASLAAAPVTATLMRSQASERAEGVQPRNRGNSGAQAVTRAESSIPGGVWASRRETSGVVAEARSKGTDQQPVRPLRSLGNYRWTWRPGNHPPTRRLACEHASGRQGESPNSTEQLLVPGQARLREDRRRSEERSRMRKGVGWPHMSDEGGERRGGRTQRSKGGQSGIGASEGKHDP
jgi:hypothetical protein